MSSRSCHWTRETAGGSRVWLPDSVFQMWVLGKERRGPSFLQAHVGPLPVAGPWAIAEMNGWIVGL